MNKENLSKMLEKAVSMQPQYRIPRYIKNYSKKIKVKKLKNNKSNTDETITGKAFWEVNLI